MGLETATYISALVPTNPVSEDPARQGDDHLRLIKAALKNTFPNLNAATTVTPAQLNYLSGVTSPILHTASLAALPAAIGTSTPVAGTFTTLSATNVLMGGVAVVPNSRQVNTGNGLSGGGALSSNLTLTLDLAHVRNVSHEAVGIYPTVGGGLQGGGDLTVDRFFGLLSSDPRNEDHSTISMIAGTGLTGGGTINASRTLSLSHLGLQNLTDPNADRIAFWDDSASKFEWLVPDASLGITTTSLTVVQATETQKGALEIATEAETAAGTDTTRAIIPANFGPRTVPVDGLLSGTRSYGADFVQVFPGGITVQGGATASVAGDGNATVTYPRAFSEVYAVQLTVIADLINQVNNITQVEDVGGTSFKVYNGDVNARRFYWTAYGKS